MNELLEGSVKAVDHLATDANQASNPTLITNQLSGGSQSNFPLAVLPSAIRQFTEECARSLPAASELIAVPALVVTAAAIGSTRVIRLKEGWTEPSSVYAAIVSPSGTKKSPALQAAAKPLQDLDSLTRRTWTADVTTERLAGMLHDNPRGLLLIRDELAAWVKSMNQYRGGKGADRQFYLSVWGGAPYRGDRKGTDTTVSLRVDCPCLSVVGCIPPDIVTDLDDDGGREDGFLARLLLAWPQPVPDRWTDAVISAQARESYENLIKELCAINWEGAPVSLGLTTDAAACFQTWYDAHSEETEKEYLSPFLKAAYSKLKGYCARLALIHALATNPKTEKINLISIQAAIELVAYFKAQAVKVAPTIVRTKPAKIERCKAEICRKLSVCRSMKKRDLQRNSAFDDGVFNQALQQLSVPEITKNADGTYSLLSVPTYRQTTTTQ